jgi:hypothetical protein
MAISWTITFKRMEKMVFHKNVKKITLVVFFLAGYFFINTRADAQNPDKDKSGQKGDLARIAILNFDDKTESEDFKYMSGSLGDAVDASMQKNFTYERVNPADVEKIIYNAKQKLIKEKIERKIDKKTDERLGFLKILAKELTVDIVIFGRYNFEKSSQMMNINTNVYYAAINEIADLPVVSNKVDSTIFGATDKAAANIIAEIQKMAQQASQKNEKTDNKIIAGEPSQKIVLTRKMAKSYVRFIDNRNATITDNFTKYIWQKCSMGQNNKTSCGGSKEAQNWNDAAEYCKNLKLGDKNWRLPKAEEIETIVDNRERPAVKVIFAPNTDMDVSFIGYWTSTLKDPKIENSWVLIMSMNSGAFIEKPKNAKTTARCIAIP